MKCEKILEEILSSNGQLTPELREHLTKCKSCRMASEEWMAIRNVKPPYREVPMTLDFSVTKAAHRFVEKRQLRHKLMTRWVSFSAAAACVTFILIASFAALSPGNKKQDSKEFASNTSVQASAPGQSIKMGPAAPQQPKASPWKDIDMRGEIFEVTFELETAIINLHSNEKKSKDNSNSSFSINDIEFIS